MRARGIVVTVADDGKQAVDILRQETFDCVLMDIQMPVMDGYEATKLLRQQERLREMPIIAMTASVMAGDREKALAAGMNDHISKPLKIETLFATLAQWIRPTSQSASLAAPATATADSLDNLPGINASTWRENGMGDDAMYRPMLKKFRDGQHDFPTRFRAAMASGDLAAAGTRSSPCRGRWVCMVSKKPQRRWSKPVSTANQLIASKRCWTRWCGIFNTS
ncbi:MAG TPA: response regulator [Burkholderiaceae bacterium]|nr:response regulator [Burkholderiaceae bacterium]